MAKSWGQWNQWPKRQPNREQDWAKSAKGKGKQASQNNGKDKSSLPGYDAQSSSALATTQQPKESLRSALVDILAENNMQIPDKYQHLVEPDITDQINMDQKALNTKRKLHARIERLKKAMSRKDDQRNQFKEELRDHLIKEQQRYEQEKSELGAALIQAQTDLDKMIKNGDEEMDAKDMEKPDVLAELLRTEAPKHSGGATMNHILEEIKKTQEENRLLAQQMGELQQQMMYMVQAFTAPPMNASPSKAGLPPHLSTPVKSPQLRRSAMEPFSRANRQRDGPYTRGAEQPPGDPQKETQNVDSEEEEVMLAKADAYLQGSS